MASYVLRKDWIESMVDSLVIRHRNDTTTKHDTSASNASNNDGDTPMTLESAVEQAKRAFALRKYEQAVDFYATALEFA
jgi:HAT1-interacting factor 1